MADKFIEALVDLKDAFTNGEELMAALVAVAANHDLPPEALRNRATIRWGDLKKFRTKCASSVGIELQKNLAKERLNNSEYIERIINKGKASRKDVNWHQDYTIGSEWSDRYKDRELMIKIDLPQQRQALTLQGSLVESPTARQCARARWTAH